MYPVGQKRKAAERKDDYLRVRVTEVQLERWQAAANLAREENDEIDFSTWVRGTLNAEARRLEERRGKGGR